jgi:hypothetical protein
MLTPDLTVPGITPLDKIREFPLDDIQVQLNQSSCSSCDLFMWEQEDIGDPQTAKARVAELVSAVGPDLALSFNWAMDFRRS